jgi:hypothetical protein
MINPLGSTPSASTPKITPPKTGSDSALGGSDGKL